uniref:Reverse transcriptase domain-containing protein n=1 Tax=Leptobrachium leishanense TaxID=445787 RepID=A0A8C5LLZ2_9ANUR
MASPEVSSYLRDKIHTTMTPEDCAMLSVPFTAGELAVVLKLMKAGKSPGPDGLPVEYYKHFAQDLSPRMLSVFNSVGADASFHPHTIEATIAVIPKPGKDGSECKNYRPISLLNADAKIFAKLLAERLKPFLPKLVRPDQVGFIPGREARDATARAIGAVAYAKQTGEGVILLSMDAEKAFDRVSWPFLFQVLRRMGLPDIFLDQVQALYTNPSARIRVNGVLSAPIPIYNGTRQGCPLSPLLFALYLEPLLEAVRSTDSITGIQGASRSHVVSAYADDLLFMLTNAETALPAVRKVLSAFGEVAGFRVNMDKSEVLNVNLSQRCVARLKRSVPFSWCTDRIKYLGIWIAPSPAQLYALNYQPLLDVFVSDLSGWTKKFISWTGRINTLKMNVVPRLLYVLQTVPISLPLDFFKRFRTAALRFIWPKGGPRVGYATLCRSKSDGGLALPDAKLYYYAVHLTRLLEWSLQKSEKLWLDLEEKLMGTPLWTLPWIRCQGPWEQSRTWCLTTETLGIWRRLRMQFGLTSSISPLLPLRDNPDFAPGVCTALKVRFDLPDRITVASFLKDGCPPPLLNSDGSPVTHLQERFNYHQIQSYLRSLRAGFSLTRPLTPFEQYFQLGIPLDRSVSTLYRLLLGRSEETPAFRERWNTLIGRNITDAEWTDTFTLVHKGTNSLKCAENAYKILTFWYRTPDRLQRMFPLHDPQCWRCKTALGDFMHIWWDCPMIQTFWKMVHAAVRTISDLDVELAPSTYILLQFPAPMKVMKRSVVLRLVTAAKLLIPLHWGKTSLPSWREWVDRVELLRRMDNLVARDLGQVEQFVRKWLHWDNYVGTAPERG